ncbi:unnamed protein product [Rotaria magnacalcarata]|nr:unnamed protein product [Rotaria magnacalcarata]CAF1683407.1 unnamed protein product [Rotaria magnacalcarata]CAF3999598.1 unnamed protein product [Rotaria magnacalcarata]CAF4024701.1 unnamed protein product [Rotaria magnacalcarata]CAF4058914.1 unnamed protein product [Rotaria magnacalcarata]
MVNHHTAMTLIKDNHIRTFMSIFTEKKPSVVKCISNFKLLKNLRVQTLGQIHDLTLMVICANGLPELRSFECTNPEYETDVIVTWPKPTNIENVEVDCILYSLSNVLLETPKLKYLNIKLVDFEPEEEPIETNCQLW